jgi:hypothetical protein
VERSERSDERRLEDLDPLPNQLTVRETERRREDFWRILLDGEKAGPACRCYRDSLVVGIKRPVTPGCRYWGSAKQCIVAPEFTGPSDLAGCSIAHADGVQKFRFWRFRAAGICQPKKERAVEGTATTENLALAREVL